MKTTPLFPQVSVTTALKIAEGTPTSQSYDFSDFSSKEDFISACIAFHADELCPDLVFFSWQDIPRCWQHSDHIDDDVFEFVACLETLPPDQQKAFGVFMDEANFLCLSPQDAIPYFHEIYLGHFGENSKEARIAYTHHYADEIGLLNDVSESLKRYFNFQDFARDLFLTDLIETEGFIFRKM